MHEPCGYALDLVCSFDSKQNKHSFYRGKDCIKKFCSDLKELGTKIITKKKIWYHEQIVKISFIKSKKNATYVKRGLL